MPVDFWSLMNTISDKNKKIGISLNQVKQNLSQQQDLSQQPMGTMSGAYTGGNTTFGTQIGGQSPDQNEPSTLTRIGDNVSDAFASVVMPNAYQEHEKRLPELEKIRNQYYAQKYNQNLK
jgi:hypothetical protein